MASNIQSRHQPGCDRLPCTPLVECEQHLVDGKSTKEFSYKILQRNMNSLEVMNCYRAWLRRLEWKIRGSYKSKPLSAKWFKSHVFVNSSQCIDRQRRVVVADFAYDKKQVEAEHYLKRGSPQDIRDRAKDLCASFSISRSTESSRWEFCDWFTIPYPKQALNSSTQSLDVVYIIQSESKTRSVSELQY